MTSQVHAYFRPRNVDVEARAGVLTDERVIGVRLARIKRAAIEAMQRDVQDTTTDNIKNFDLKYKKMNIQFTVSNLGSL